MWHQGYVDTMLPSGQSTIRLYQSGASYTTTKRPDLGVGTQVNVVIDLASLEITCVMTDTELQTLRESDADYSRGQLAALAG